MTNTSGMVASVEIHQQLEVVRIGDDRGLLGHEPLHHGAADVGASVERCAARPASARRR